MISILIILSGTIWIASCITTGILFFEEKKPEWQLAAICALLSFAVLALACSVPASQA